MMTVNGAAGMLCSAIDGRLAATCMHMLPLRMIYAELAKTAGLAEAALVSA